MKKLLTLILFPVLLMAQNPQSIQFPRGMKIDSIFSLGTSSILFRIEQGRNVLRLWDDSTVVYASNVNVAKFSNGSISLYSPLSKGTIDWTDSIRISGASTLDAVILRNPTVATNLVQQSSPYIKFSSNGWDPTAGASKTIVWRLQTEAFSSAGYGGAVLTASVEKAATATLKPFAIDEQGRTLFGEFTGQNFTHRVQIDGNVKIGFSAVSTLEVDGAVTFGSESYHRKGVLNLWDDDENLATIEPATLSGATTYTLPNHASGTFMLLSDTLSISQRIDLKLNTASVGSMAYVDSTKYHGSASITTVGTLSAGSVPISLVTGEGSMAYVDSTKYHGSASINTIGTITGGTWQGDSIQTAYIGWLLSDKYIDGTSVFRGSGGVNTSGTVRADGGLKVSTDAFNVTNAGIVTEGTWQAASISTTYTDAKVTSYPGAGIALSTGSAWSTSITNNSTDWNTAYTDRMKWDGGSTGLVAATGRTSLGLSSMALVDSTLYHGSASINTIGTLTSGAIGSGFTSIATTYTAAKYVGTYYSQTTAPGSPVAGDIWTDTDDTSVYIYAGGNWRLITSW